MRLQLIVLILATSPAALATAQESAARVRSAVYHDDDDTTVVTAAVEVEAEIEDRVGLTAGYLADVVTSASVDVVSAATQRWDERRDEFRGGASLYGDDVTVSAGYVRSVENDYASHRMSVGGAVDLNDGLLAVSLGLSAILSEVGRADDPVFHEDVTTLGANAQLVSVLSPDAILSVGYGLQYFDGYQASPYRHVRLADGSARPETHPDTRARNSLTVRLRHSLSDSVALGLDERLYLDDWGIFGTTTQLSFAFTLSPAVDLELRDRFHFQQKASFFQESYQQPQEYVSSDRELSTFIDNYAGAALVLNAEDVGPFHQVRFDLRADFFIYRFFDYALLDGRIGTLVSIGVEGTL